MITHLRVIETLRLLSWQSCLPPPAAFFRLTSDELESCFLLMPPRKDSPLDFCLLPQSSPKAKKKTGKQDNIRRSSCGIVGKKKAKAKRRKKKRRQGLNTWGYTTGTFLPPGDGGRKDNNSVWGERGL